MRSFLRSQPSPHGGPPTLISPGFQDEQGVVVAHPKHLLTPPPGTRRWTALAGHQQGQVARRKPAPACQLVLRHAQIFKQFPHRVPVRPHPWGARDACASPRLLPPPARAAGRVGCPPRAPPAGARTGRPSLTRSGGDSLCVSTCSALYWTGPETVNSRELDSFLPSRVQMAPCAPQCVVTPAARRSHRRWSRAAPLSARRCCWTWSPASLSALPLPSRQRRATSAS